MRRIAVVFGVVVSLVLPVAAQYAVRTVTNADLAKYREQRLTAERELRDNYAELGFPSPEELNAMRDRDMADQIHLSEQLRRSRFEEERIGIERSRLILEAARIDLERDTRMADDEYAAYSGYSGYGQTQYGYNPYGYSRYGIGVFGRYGSIGIGGGFYDPRMMYRYPSNRVLPLFSQPGYLATPYGAIPRRQNMRPAPIFRGRRR